MEASVASTLALEASWALTALSYSWRLMTPASKSRLLRLLGGLLLIDRGLLTPGINFHDWLSRSDTSTGGDENLGDLTFDLGLQNGSVTRLQSRQKFG